MAYTLTRASGNQILLFQTETAILSNWNPTGNQNNDIDAASYCPVGAKIALVRGQFVSSSVNRSVNVESVDDGVAFSRTRSQIANQIIDIPHGFVPIDSSGDIRIHANHTDISGVYIWIMGCVM